MPLESETKVPPEPAGPLNVTVPVLVLPAVTDVGFKDTETSEAPAIVKLAVWLTPFNEALKVTVV